MCVWPECVDEFCPSCTRRPVGSTAAERSVWSLSRFPAATHNALADSPVGWEEKRAALITEQGDGF